uniref:Translation elongation factor EFTs/EF1B dimerisation domain-containing protein n=1 Tax=Oncorhynchus tshawytscha TaxID=74940 RepID=A0A8C8F010_ONCTS
MLSFDLQQVQSLHTGCPLHAAEKALLMKLRTSTCVCVMPTFSPTKEGRRAMEGLISLFVGDKAAVMVEVNCETDFVARNERFQQLVKDVAFATMAHHCSKNQSHTGYVKCLLAAEDLSKLNLGEGASLADQLALTVGRGAGHTGRKLRHPVVGEAPISLGSTDDLPCRDTETRLTVAQYLTEQGARVVDFVCVQCWEAGSDGA